MLPSIPLAPELMASIVFFYDLLLSLFIITVSFIPCKLILGECVLIYQCFHCKCGYSTHQVNRGNIDDLVMDANKIDLSLRLSR